ncbi:N-formylglutamate deformylase [Sneathiella sp.]|uniref:N-formylglutamate deformylase n=1 Tax=Sneathiella sp. TaxID=1964365 RepID=UPI0035699BA7
MSDIYTLTRRSSPLLLSQPHAGTEIPAALEKRMTKAAQGRPDTDWHMARLYDDMAEALGASVITANYSRFVIDLNRDPDGISLYPGMSVTELCPLSLFDDAQIYLDGQNPEEAEISERKIHYWQPYHDALASEIDRIKAEHGYALLYDCHSIRCILPRFFEGRLPTLNLGTGDGKTLAPDLERAVEKIAADSPYSHALNGRYKGGYITRHYGDPAQNVQALQMELAQEDYMEEVSPFPYLDEKAKKLQPTLKLILEEMLDWGQRTRDRAEGPAI